MHAWHWVSSNDEGLWVTGHGDLVVEPGQVLHHDGPIEMCRSGLHGSPRIIDALDYARGSIICRVEMHDIVAIADDKVVARKRVLLWGFDAEDVLWEWARRCALSALRYWDAPDVVANYLRTGNDILRDAARAAAWAAAWDAARDAAWAAARAAARAAAWDAARAAAWDAARDAAWAAARDAARDAQDRWLRYRVFAEARRRGFVGG
jgi:hypothetical protein